MEMHLEYSFDDEPVTKSYHDLEGNKTEVHFNGYFDFIKNGYMENPFIWIIENWEYAKSRLGDE